MREENACRYRTAVQEKAKMFNAEVKAQCLWLRVHEELRDATSRDFGPSDRTGETDRHAKLTVLSSVFPTKDCKQLERNANRNV